MSVSNVLASANRPVRVLKFGGSVLASESAFDDAVREIESVRNGGLRVLAVTSARKGTTDRLLEAARRRHLEAPPRALAVLLATGEIESAALLSLALHAAGIENELLDPDRARLRVRGPVLDADPVDVDVEILDKALTRRGVAVLPGFYGRRSSGEIALLGRGGSDLTALFVAERLGAEECYLLKDVGGLYSHDPAGTREEAPARYTAASWEELLRVGGGLVQKKAVEFARRHRLSFLIAAPCAGTATRVGPVTELHPFEACRVGEVGQVGQVGTSS